MKYILIDTNNKEIKEIDIEFTLANIYKLLECKNIEHVAFGLNNDSMYVDELGLYTDKPHFGLVNPVTKKITEMVGNAIIFQPDYKSGEEQSPKSTLKEIKQHILF